jgi:hypothetical protein
MLVLVFCRKHLQNNLACYLIVCVFVLLTAYQKQLLLVQLLGRPLSHYLVLLHKVCYPQTFYS